MWKSKSKLDLVIEVWEKLDCESIGRSEIEAIEIVVGEEYGISPTDTPMKLARILADEGAELRHAELLELDVERRTSSPELPILGKPLEVGDLKAAKETIDELEKIRRKYENSNNRDGVRQLRKKVIAARDRCLLLSENASKSQTARSEAAEIAELISIWLQSPEIYKAWTEAKFTKTAEAEEIKND